MSNRFVELLKMTWKIIVPEVAMVYYNAIVGAMFFGALMMIFTIAYLGKAPGWFTKADLLVVLIAMMNAVWNAFCICAFFLIIIFLCLFAFAFTHLCWLYDGKSWMIPRAIIDWYDRLNQRYRKCWELNQKSRAATRTNIMKKLDKIRKGDDL